MAEDNFRQPDNLSLSSPNTFQFSLLKIPNVVYNIQRLEIPGITISGTQVATGPWTHADFTVPGEKMTYDPLTIGILMDEDMVGWKEIHDWMRRLIINPGLSPVLHPLKEMSDATLLLQNNKFNANIAFTFYNSYPTYMGAVSLDYQTGPDIPVVYDLTLNYSHYEMKYLNR